MKFIILLAGIGSRLGNPFPKCLTPIGDNVPILGHQLSNIKKFNGEVIGVVGFKKEYIMEYYPKMLFVYNSRYAETNTSQSLLCALNFIKHEDVLWMNGDIVFDPEIINKLIECPYSSMAVLKKAVGDEEVKFTVDEKGFISNVSKNIQNGLGEAIGINIIKAKDLETFKKFLLNCNDHDYFEKGLELAIQSSELVLCPVDVTPFRCIEIDFEEDLRKAKTLFGFDEKNKQRLFH